MKKCFIQLIGILIFVYIPYSDLYADENYHEARLPSSITNENIESTYGASAIENNYPDIPGLRAAGDPNDPNNQDEPELGLPVGDNIKYILFPFFIYVFYVINKSRIGRKMD